VAVFAPVEQFVGDEGGGGICRDTAVFLEPLVFVNALGAKAGEEGVVGLRWR
jgi:hypothetical protein